MTLAAFIEYLLDNDCETARDLACQILQIKRRGRLGATLKTTIAYTDKYKKTRASTICRVCSDLKINIPESARHAENILNDIIEMHRKEIGKVVPPSGRTLL